MNWIWIKKNQNILAAVATLLLIVLCGIPLWLYMNEQQNKAASESYSQALQLVKKDDSESLKAAQNSLKTLIAKHQKSKVARLAELELAQINLHLKDTDGAIQTYESLLSELSRQDPLRPLALAGLKSSYELKGNTEKVKNLSAELQKLGFTEK